MRKVGFIKNGPGKAVNREKRVAAKAGSKGKRAYPKNPSQK